MAFSTGRNDGRSAQSLDDIDTGYPPAILWSVEGGKYGAPCFEYDNKVFTWKGQGGAIDLGYPPRELIQLDLSDGTENWAVQLTLPDPTLSQAHPIGIASTGLYIAAAGYASYGTGYNYIYFLDPVDGSTVATSAVEIFTSLGGQTSCLITEDGDVVGAGKDAYAGYTVRIAGYARDALAIGDVVWAEDVRRGTGSDDLNWAYATANDLSTFTELDDGTIVYTSPFLYPPAQGTVYYKAAGMQIAARNGATGELLADRQIVVGVEADNPGGFYCPSYVTSAPNADGKEIITTLISNSPGYYSPPANYVAEWEFAGNAFTLVSVCGGAGAPAWGSYSGINRDLETPMLRPGSKRVPPVEHGVANVNMDAYISGLDLVFTKRGEITKTLGFFCAPFPQKAGFHCITDAENRTLVLARDSGAGGGNAATNTFGMISDAGTWIWRTTIPNTGFSNIEIANNGDVLVNANGYVTCYSVNGTTDHRPPGDLVTP